MDEDKNSDYPILKNIFKIPNFSALKGGDQVFDQQRIENDDDMEEIAL